MSELGVDDRGYPILFASSSDSPAVLPSKHGLGGFDISEQSRRHDAVREAAREFESYSAQDLTEWLKGKTKRDLSQAEIDSFLNDVREQQLSDLVDIVDHGSRGVLRGRRTVRIQAPKGYVKKTLKSLNDDELSALIDRLQSRGWDQQMIWSQLSKHLPESKLASIKPA